jgi:CubicO group peptidase (beta-lactamase class C family)
MADQDRLSRRQLAAGALSGIIALAASPIARVRSEESAMSAIDALAESQVRDGIAPGISVAIAKNGQLIYSKAIGFRDLAKKLPMLSTTHQHIGSAMRYGDEPWAFRPLAV